MQTRAVGVTHSGSVHMPSGGLAFDVATRVSLIAALGLLVSRAVVPGLVEQVAPLLLVGGLLAGLPHGAADHLVPVWVGAKFSIGRQVALLISYAGAALGAFLLLRAFPLVGLILFLTVSGLHFGAGEVRFSSLRDGRPHSRDPLAVAAFGGVTALLPLVLWPRQTAPLLSALVPGTSGIVPHSVRLAVTALVLGTAAAAVANFIRRGRRVQAGELTILVAMFSFVSPLAAFGVYFGAWHSVRHLARMLALDPANGEDLARGDLRAALRRFSRTAAAPTLAALATLGILWLSAGDWRGFAAADVSLLAGLTLPHVITVGWLDRRTGASR